MIQVIHASGCALHNGPAMPIGECDCGASVEAVMIAGLVRLIEEDVAAIAVERECALAEGRRARIRYRAVDGDGKEITE